MEEQGYGGWMVWALDTDDFNGAFCEQGPHPLLKALQEKQMNATTSGVKAQIGAMQNILIYVYMEYILLSQLL